MHKSLRYYVLIARRRIAFQYSKWLFSSIGSFIGIASIYFFHNTIKTEIKNDCVLLIGSFGATSVIVFGTPHSPYALPKHVIGGHVLSAIIGVSIYHLGFQDKNLWIAAGMTVALAILVMQITHTIHPPAGATALIAIMGSQNIHKLGYWYVITPVLSGALTLLGVLFLMKQLSTYIQFINSKYNNHDNSN